MDAAWDRSKAGGGRAEFIRIAGPFRDGLTAVLFLGDAVPVWVHWDKRTVPCLGDDCKRCPDGRQRVAYAPGLISVRDGDAWKSERVVFAIPQGNVEAIERLQPLRGKLIYFERKRANATPKVTVPPRKPPEDLPAEFDVVACLRRIWGLDHKRAEQQPVEENREILKFRKMA